jgi:hypothetical protein
MGARSPTRPERSPSKRRLGDWRFALLRTQSTPQTRASVPDLFYFNSIVLPILHAFAMFDEWHG